MVAELAPPATEPEEFRPAPSGGGFGRWLRARIGVVEEVLDYTPELRPYYTKVGALVMTTSAMAVVSMWFALADFMDVHWLALLPAAVFWGVVIFCIDSYLITTLHGASKGGSAFWLRLPLAVFLGLVIAEPLVLTVFESAIHRQVAENRELERTSRESELNACNPVPYRELKQDERARCKAQHLLLTVPSDPGAVSKAIADLQGQRQQKQNELDADRKKLAGLQKIARDECAGNSGAGLTGERGDGPRCDEADQDAADFDAKIRQSERQQAIGELDGRINDLIEKRDAAGAAYATEMNKAIEAKLPDPDGDIGLLEEHKALGTLSGESLLVLLGPWVLRLLLITIDCIPVLAKGLVGRTFYDDNIDLQRSMGRELFEVETELRRRSGRLPRETAIAELDKVDRARESARAAEEERTRIQQDQELYERIDEYARRLRGEV